MKIKNLSLLCMTAVLLSGTFVSCARTQTTDTPTTTQAAIDTVQAVETEAEPAETMPPLEIRDFGGRDFRISVSRRYVDEMWVESENGDVCNDAVFRRNQKIEEAYNVNIVAIPAPNDSSNAQVNEINKVLTAGDDVFDLTAVYTFLAGGPALKGHYYSWNDIPYVALDEKWWIQSANDAFSVNGEQYVAVGDLSVTTLLLTYAVFFNKRLVDDYDLPDLYKTVLDGKWTIDYLNSLTRDIYQDLNGSGTADEGDLYGFAADKVTNLDAYPSAFDIPLIKQDDNGAPYVAMDIERMTTGVEKVYALYYNSGNSSYIPEAGKEITAFASGNVAFLTTWIDNAFTEFREMTDDYGILPYPKLDEAQKEYYTNSMDNYSLLSVPKTVSDVEFVGLITEAMTRESHLSVIPAYYDVALTQKYARDEASVAMLDLIMAGRMYDFSILHSGKMSSLPYLFRDLVAKKDTNVASKFAKIESKLNSGIASLIETYAEVNQ